LLIAQITDTHVDAPGVAHPTGYDGPSAVARVAAALAGLDPRPDLVVMTGDLAATAGTAEEYRAVRAAIAGFGLPAMAVPGNHDAREGFAGAFAGTPVRTGTGAFLHLAVDAGPLRVIGLDTLSPGEIGGRLCNERLGWLEARLAEAQDRPTVVFMHHPPFPVGMALLDSIGLLEGAEALAAMLARHRQVRRVLAGHVHRAVTRDWAGVTASTCPSVAYEFALDLTPGAAIRPRAHPPGFQLHAVDSAGSVLTHTAFLPSG
jgi:3',5'-cyclic AMP phosphodiesterase CpdA